MKQVFVGLKAAFFNLSVNQKLMAAFSMLCVPMVILVVTFTNSSNEKIHQAHSELVGLEYNAGLRQLAQRVAEHRGMSAAYLGGDASFRGKIAERAEIIAELIAEQNSLDTTHGKSLGSTDTWTAWAREWLAYEPGSLNDPGPRNFAQHTDYIDRILQLNLDVGYASQLSLDPGADSYYLMDVVTLKMLFWTESAGILRGLASGISARGNATRAEQIRLLTLRTKLEELSNAIGNSLNTALQANNELAPLSDLAKGYLKANGEFVSLVTREVIEPASVSADPKNVFGKGTEAIGAAFKLYDRTEVALKQLIKSRASDETYQRNLTLGASGLFTAIAFFGITFAVRTVSSGVNKVVKVFERIQARDYDSEIEIKTQDEIGQLLESLKQMQGNLREQIDRDRKANEANSRRSQALDSASAAVTVADAAHNLTFLNQAAKALFESLAAEVNRVNNDANVTDLMGQPLTFCAPDAHSLRNHIEGLTGAEEFDFTLGDRTLRLNCSPVLVAGERVGSVVEWRDLTEKLRQQQLEAQQLDVEREKAQADREAAIANGRIREALDSVSARVLVADEKGKIIYANDAVTSMFSRDNEQISKALGGFDLKRLVGQQLADLSCDKQQRAKELQALKTESEQILSFGPRTYRAISTPIVAEGVRTGTVVEWEDRTEQLRVEEEIDRIVAAAAAGDLTRRMSVEEEGTFNAQLAAGFNRLLDINEQSINDLGRVMSALSEGNLDQKIDTEYSGAFEDLKQYANGTMDKLSSVALEMTEGAEDLRTLALEIATGNNQLSERTQQQAAAINRTSSSIAEFADSAQQNSERASSAAEMAKSARGEAQTGHEQVKDMVVAMNVIAETSQKIGEIIGVINDIAFQTNLLALNAAVEAARAGEQGRGFAVVASEVRNLAQRCASAAHDIKDLINDSLTKVDEGNQLAERSGVSLEQIVKAIEAVDAVVDEIAAASSLQSNSVQQVHESIREMDTTTQQNAAMVEEVAASSESMGNRASGLETSIKFFKLG